ncbi:dihydrodipicolinate synthase family protein [Microlunatus parietis]|uniref:Dihydrodipicolinate synthase/N-acetylneuraminate lyase n=1 Tax=Microlunatus parietis TaxID=682979 RepID=A0A7Y9I5J8_9ACTN|nr:dihydrodipicolinate synthase family protein [Microlunatus parietis]NYE70674.1 dihydrodipicolinate synthase/N-acetylneuraminate lyase [Microlunatus parietis]
MNPQAFAGITTMIITPYADDGTVAPEIATELARRVDAAGIDVIAALGNTAEMQQLDAAERTIMLRAVAAGRQRAQLLAGVSGSVGDVIMTAAEAADLGYHAIMVHEPADPFGDSADVAGYYERIADRSPLPAVLYLRSPRLALGDLGRLAGHPGIAAVKYARDDLLGLSTLLNGPTSADCVWVNGLAESRVPAFAALGITGFTTGIGNVRPELCVAVRDAVINNDLPRLYALLDLVRSVEVLRAAGNNRCNVSVLKELLRLDGLPAGGVRPPHAPLDDPARTRLQDAWRAWTPDRLRALGVAVPTP